MTDVLLHPQKPRVLLLPGWLNSDAAHWQSRWEVLHGYTRVEQDDWTWPRRGDWMARLDEVIQQQEAPVVLVAHSLGCQLVAAWAAHSQHTDRVLAAWLVAPPDTEREATPPNLFNWRPMVRSKLPFPSRALVSSDDPYCALDRAEGLARDWGSEMELLGPCGHINGESGLGDWDDGHRAMTQWLLTRTKTA
ncbi:MAG: RBBP9/YdeN family alpha/beta hydrolase [Burkholderiales bacterium]